MHQINRLLVVDTGITNPYINLAVEEYLYEHWNPGDMILYLWQNESSVVLGQNQSVYSQCNLDVIRLYEINIVRRKSGGGAVYHDLGNLNYTFISQYYDEVCSDNLKIVCDALSALGINAVSSGRNDILADGKKISGNAFLRDDKKICHHGTLLIDCDLSLMYDALNVMPSKWKDKGIDSVRSRTVNISDINSNVTVGKVKKALSEMFVSVSDDAKVLFYRNLSDITENIDDIQKLSEVYSSDKWIFEKKIMETLWTSDKFSWGEAEIKICLKKNHISDMIIFSDMIEMNVIPKIIRHLLNKQFTYQAISEGCDSAKDECTFISEKKIISDIEKMLLSEMIK